MHCCLLKSSVIAPQLHLHVGEAGAGAGVGESKGAGVGEAVIGAGVGEAVQLPLTLNKPRQVLPHASPLYGPQ